MFIITAEMLRHLISSMSFKHFKKDRQNYKGVKASLSQLSIYTYKDRVYILSQLSILSIVPQVKIKC